MIKLSRNQLFTALQRVIGAVERRNTFPILAYVLLEVSEDLLSITATDLEVELKGFARLENVQPDFKVTLPGRKLFDICKALPEKAPLEIVIEKQQVTITSGRSKFSLTSLPVQDFPCVEREKTSTEYIVSQKNLRFLIERTQFAMAQQDVRYYLNGMLFDFTGDKLTVVATDGHRLAVAHQQLSYPHQSGIKLIVPRKGIQELFRLLDNLLGEVTFEVELNHIRFISEQFVLTSKLIDGQFPDYNRVMPKMGNKVVSLSKDELKQILNRVSILSNEKYRGIRFELQNNTLLVNATNPEQEQAQEEITINYHGDNLELGFNVTYLLDVLSVIEAETIKMYISDSNTGVLIEENDNSNSLYVVMPMRV